MSSGVAFFFVSALALEGHRHLALRGVISLMLTFLLLR